MRRTPGICRWFTLVLVPAFAACGDDGGASPRRMRCEPLAIGNTCRPLGPSTKTATATLASDAPEACNGIDDDLDGAVDDGDVCAAACSASALAAAAEALVLPTAESRTVPTGSETVPELTAVSEVPAWCLAPTTSEAAGEIAVGCGERREFGAHGLDADRLSVAPGGVLRVSADATLRVAGTLLVCPGGIIEAGGEMGENGHDLTIEAGTLLVLGRIESPAGPDAWPIGTGPLGDAGAIVARADRLLLAGTMASAGRTRGNGFGRYLDGGRAGALTIEVPPDTGESFLSGTLDPRGGNGGNNLGCGQGGPGGDSGDLSVTVPVCCHGTDFAIVGGNGGGGGVGEDGFESSEPVPLAAGSTDLSLCDGDDRFTLTLAAGDVVALTHDEAVDAVDIDLELQVGDSVVARSEGVGSDESVTAPADGTFIVRVYAFGQVHDPGFYRLTITPAR